jgi:hypothetical protein
VCGRKIYVDRDLLALHRYQVGSLAIHNDTVGEDRISLLRALYALPTLAIAMYVDYMPIIKESNVFNNLMHVYIIDRSVTGGITDWLKSIQFVDLPLCSSHHSNVGGGVCQAPCQ